MTSAWKAHLFIYPWNNVYNRCITSNLPFRWQRTTSTTSGWISSIFNRNSSGERRLIKIFRERRRRRRQESARKAQRTSLSTAKATSSAQRPQTCTEAATKCYNYTANGADEEREHRPSTLQKAMGRSGNAYGYSKIASMQRRAATVTRSVQCTSRISFQRTEDSLSAFTPWATNWVLQ